MTIITITRLFQTTINTVGTISIDGRPICWSLEPPWKMNKKGKSCIIPGWYTYKHYESSKSNRTCIKLFNVYNREYVSMHPGNTHKDTRACILPGMYIGTLNNFLAVINSKAVMSSIISETNQIGKIHIIEKY